MNLPAKIIKEVLVKRNGVEVLPGLVCKVLNETHLPQVHKILASDYVNNPVAEIFRLPKNRTQHADAAVEYLKGGASTGFFEKGSDRLAALMINSVQNKAEGDPPLEITPALSEPVAVHLRFINELIGDVFRDLNTDCYVRGRCTWASAEHRSKGLTGILSQITFNLARANGCEYHVCYLASLFIQKIAKSEGYSVLREISYADYIDPQTGLKPDWKLSPIHKTAQVVYKKIPVNL